MVYSAAVLLLVEPSIDGAIEIENQALFASGEAQDTAEFRADYEQYRIWQKSGMILGSLVMGTSLGALFGILFIIFQNRLPGRSTLQKSMVLAAASWAVLYLAPFIKYPPNPPAAGDPETLVLRTVLGLALIAILGGGALGCFIAYNAAPRRARIILALYVVMAASVMVLLPASPDAPSDMPNLAEFHATSMASMIVYWAVLALIMGGLWNRYRPLPPLS